MSKAKTSTQLLTSLPFLLMTCNTIVETCMSVILHQYRFRRLSLRIKAVQAHITPLFDQTQTVLKDPENTNVVLLLKTSLEDILAFSKRFLKNDRKLAIRIFKFGTDEEEFIKLSERIENCINALNLPVDLAIFKHSLDDEDFIADCKTLKTHSVEILSLLTAKSRDREKIDRMVQQLATLVSEQDGVRKTYRNKRPLASDITLEEADVECLELLGAGSFGQVFRGRYKNEVVAIKKLQSGALSSEAVRHFKTEASMMRRLSHPRTLACIGVSDSPGSHCMVVEYMENRSLADYIAVNESNPAEWPYRLDIALDIAVGMSYLHRLQIIHRSLKSANILLDQKLRVKIADFGMSIARTETATIMKIDEFGKSSQYMAPECFGLSPKYSTKSDIFSYAMILWELSHWKMAFSNLDTFEIKDVIRSGERLPIHDAIPRSFESIIMACWDQEQAKRPAFADILAFLEVIDFSEGVSNENSIFKIKPAKQANALLAGGSMNSIPQSPGSFGSTSPSSATFTPLPSTKMQSVPSIAPSEANISNSELTTFWSDYLSVFQDEINWDTFFLYIIDTLKIKAPFKLDTDKLRKKMDLKMTTAAPTLKKVYQMIQDKNPNEFFSHYIVNTSLTLPSVNESIHETNDLAKIAPSSNPSQVVIKMDSQKSGVAQSPTERKKSTWIYMCLVIFALLGGAVAAIILSSPK